MQRAPDTQPAHGNPQIEAACGAHGPAGLTVQSPPADDPPGGAGELDAAGSTPKVLVERFAPLGERTALSAIRKATDPDELLLRLALGAHAHCSHVRLLLHEPAQATLLAYLDLDEGQLSMVGHTSRSFSVSRPSQLSLIIGQGTVYVGPLPQATAEVLDSARVREAQSIALVPVFLHGRMFCIVLGHNGAAPLDHHVGPALTRLALEAAVGLSKMTPAPAAPRTEGRTTPAPRAEGRTAAMARHRAAPPPSTALVRRIKSMPSPLDEGRISALVQALNDRNEQTRRQASRTLHRRLAPGRLEQLMHELRHELTHPDPRPRAEACRQLGLLGDAGAVSTLAALLSDPERSVAEAAHEALVTITAQDFGLDDGQWESWWRTNRDLPRERWLADGLVHARLELRTLASEQLKQLMDQPPRYDPRASRRERQEARQSVIEQLSFRTWWDENDI